MPKHLMLLVAMASLGGCGWFGDDTPTSSEDLAAIAEFNRQYLAAINAGDIDALLELTSDAQIMIAPNREPIAGKADTAAAFRRMFEEFDIEESWSPGETALGGDWAYQRGRFRVVATPKAGGDARTTTGHYLRILARQPDGTWRMTIDMFNNDALVSERG